MRLTSYTDYALRTLIYLAEHRDALVTIEELAQFQHIPKNHLTKVVHHLGQLELVATVRGRNGGIKLGKEPEEIVIGQVVRQTETDFNIVECFNKDTEIPCVYSNGCRLKGVLTQATNTFLKVLDDVNLKNLIHPSSSAPLAKRIALKIET
jgi:Rrf2 family nitric oxide-sensitive transcriptional repressor